MANSNGLITAPVSIYDLQVVLGKSDTDLGTLCKANTINKWAKYKPFRYSSVSITPVVDVNGYPTKQTAVGSHHRCLVEANCGLYLASDFRNKSLQDIIVKAVAQLSANNDDDVWVYQKPNGGASQPYRTVDFCGYNREALPFIWQSNISNKKVRYQNGMDVNFDMEVFDSSNETNEGMIEASDLQDSIYNSNSLYYVAVICHPYIINTPSDSSNVMAYSIASHPISHADGKVASFTLSKSGNNYVFSGTSTQHTSNALKYKVVHMLARKDSDNTYTFLPLPFTSSFPPVTNLELITQSTSVQFVIESFANFASNGSAISSLTFQSINNDISINAWTGLTVKCRLTNSSSSAVAINMGLVYCETNCHNGIVASAALYDTSYNALSRVISVPANSYVDVYITFDGVFDTNTIDNADVEISLWGVDENDEPTINHQTFGNDGTIIYHK